MGRQPAAAACIETDKERAWPLSIITPRGLFFMQAAVLYIGNVDGGSVV